MAITALGTLKEQVRDKLAYLTTVVNASTAVGHTDVNHDAEDLYCGLLNLAFDWNISNTNDDQMNSAAIDLADKDADTLLGRGEKGVALQVTSTVERKKVEHTLTKFAEHNLQSHYKRLIILMIGQKRGYQGEFTLPAGLDFQKTRDIWDTDDLTRELHALHPDKLEAINKYLTEQLPIWQEKAKKPELNLPLPMTMDEDRFVGREDELKEIRAKLEQSSVVYLTGLGGMGKTELAIKFGRKYRDGEVYFVRFQESFERTVSMNVAQGIEGLLEQGPEVAYAQAMKRLGKCGKNDILIIDNADEPSGNFADLKDKTWNKLRNLDMKLLITTRCDVAKAVKVGAMKTELLRQLFQNQESPLKEKQMDDLIDAVRGHTMMVDMMAKTLRRNRRLTAEELLEILRKGTLSEKKLRAIAIEKNGDTEQEQIYVHLKNLFSMAELNEMDKDILGDLVLLPEAGVEMAVLDPVYTEEEWERLEQLIDAGWLNLEPKTKRVTMHPVVRLVCRQELKPDDENCGNFLDAVWDQYDPKQYDANLFRQWAELFSQAADLLPDREGEWALYSGRLWNELGLAHMALPYYLGCLPRYISNGLETAIVYNELGCTYFYLGQYLQAKEYLEIALNMLTTSNVGNNREIARVYNDLGRVYGALGNHHKALELKQNACRIRETMGSSNDLELAQSYNNVGATYSDLGDYKKSLQYKLDALAIRIKVLPPEHPELAQSYNNIGYTYGKLRDYRSSLEYTLRAMEIWQKVLPGNHPDLAKSYSSVAYAYGNLNNHEKALEFKLKSLEIRKEILPSEHPDIAQSYNSVGCEYDELGKPDEALKYKKHALEIIQRTYSPDAPLLAKYYNSIGYTYGALGDISREIEYKEKALVIHKQESGGRSIRLAKAINGIAYSYGELGEHSKALDLKLSALEIFIEVLPQDSIELVAPYIAVAYSYDKLGDNQKSLRFRLNALSIQEKMMLPTDLHLAVSYGGVAWDYEKLGDYETALNYARRALNIAENAPTLDEAKIEKYRKRMEHLENLVGEQ